MPNSYVNKITANGQTLIDLTADTAIASDVAAGKYFHLATGERVVGTASGGIGDTYTLTTIVPQQSFTPQEISGSYQNTVTYTAGLEDGEYYLVTFDGTEYICECGLYWGSDYLAGHMDTFWGGRGEHVYPFGLGYTPSVPEFSVGTFDLNQHTIKVEHLEFVDGPLTIIPKSITANGTYNASSDNADGYSSVMVNVPTGGGASNIVQGSFTGTTAGSALDVSVNYNGNGYPIALFIWVDGGVVGNSTFDSAVQRYAIASYTVFKTHESYEPTYNPSSSSSDNHDCSMNIARYKSSTSSATSYANQANNAVYAFSNANAESGSLSAVKIKSNKVLSVYIANSGYGFMTNIKYNYVVVYSE